MDQFGSLITIGASAFSAISVVVTALVWMRKSAAADARNAQRTLAVIESMAARVSGVEEGARATNELVCEVRKWVHELREWRAAERESNRLVEHRLHRLEEEQRAAANRTARGATGRTHGG